MIEILYFPSLCVMKLHVQVRQISIDYYQLLSTLCQRHLSLIQHCKSSRPKLMIKNFRSITINVLHIRVFETDKIVKSTDLKSLCESICFLLKSFSLFHHYVNSYETEYYLSLLFTVQTALLKAQFSFHFSNI